jgi:hypothetical protein
MAAPELFANSPVPGSLIPITTLGTAVTTTGTTTITTTGAAPASLQLPGQFRIVIDSEIMIVTAGASGTSWTVTRGAEGSTAATHANGTNAFHYLTAGALATALTFSSGALVWQNCTLATNVTGVNAIARRSFNSIDYASRTNTVIPAPGTIVNGDILLIWFSVAAATTAPTPTPPAGFTVAPGSWPISETDAGSFNMKSYVWWKVAASESGSYTVTHAVGSSTAFIGAYSGADQTTPLAPTPVQNTGTSSPSTGLSVTTPRNGSMVVYCEHDWGDTANTLTQPTGTTPTFAKVWQGIIGYVADGVLASAGATGINTMTNNNASSSELWATAMVVIQPASNTLQAAIDQFGIVHLKGGPIVNGTGATVTVGTTIFTLPAGCWPATSTYPTGATDQHQGDYALAISPTGTVAPSSFAWANAYFLYLEGMTFSV